MDIDILNSGTPSSKIWLKPVCNDIQCNDINADSITCNELSAAVIFGDTKTPVLPLTTKLFQIGVSLGANFPLISTTTPANLTVINNPFISLGSNTYQAITDQYLQVIISYTLVPPPAGALTGINNCVVLVNGGISFINCSCSSGLNIIEPFTLSCSGIIRLSAGDIVSVSFVNTGFTGGWRYSAFCFSGVVL